MAKKHLVILDSAGRLVKEAVEGDKPKQGQKKVWVHENHFEDLQTGNWAWVEGKMEKCDPVSKAG